MICGVYTLNLMSLNNAHPVEMQLAVLSDLRLLGSARLEPTIAARACFPFVMLSEEAGIARRDYAALRRWCDHARALPHFMPMSGIFSRA